MMKKYYRNRHATFIKALLEEKKQKQEQEEIEKLKQEKRKKKLKDKVLNNLIPASRVEQEEESTN
jgi:DNA recombination-dependent growth factor C